MMSLNDSEKSFEPFFRDSGAEVVESEQITCRSACHATTSGVKGIIHCVCDVENRIDFGELEELLDIRTWTNDDDSNSFGSTGNVVTDEDSQARGVHLRHMCEVEDVARWSFTAGIGSEIKDIPELHLLHRSIHVASVENSGDLVDESAWYLALNSLNRERRALPHFCPRGRHLMGL